MKLGKCNFSICLLNLNNCMQIIHRFSGSYPFGLEHQTQNTFAQLLKQNLSEEEISHYKLKYKFFKEMALTNLIKLVKLSRENNNLRFLYEYEPLSLEQYLQRLSHESRQKIDPAAYRCLIYHFKSNLETIIKQLIHYQIKTDLLINNLAVLACHTSPFELKLFVEPQCECFALQVICGAKHDELKHLIHQNKLILVEFYSSQKKKLVIQFEELMQLYFGKLQEEENRPNFIINGAKLVFINQQQIEKQSRNQNRQTKKSTSSDKINFNLKGYHQKPKKGSGQDSLVKQITEVSRKKVNDIKCELAKKHTVSKRNIQENQSAKGKDYCDHIHFQPAEITKDRTLIVQEQQYLQSLEEQIRNMYKRGSNIQQAQKTRRISPIQDKMLSIGTTNQPKFQNGKPACNKEGKPQKKHKYKMKIITSHDVEIEEEKDPQVVNINRQNFSAEADKRLYLLNSCQNKQNQSSYQNSEPTERRIIQARYSDGDTQILNKEGINKVITTSLINHDQTQSHQASGKCFLCKPQTQEHQADGKQTHFENYLHKIQTAKQKAQKLLKQYAQHKVKKN